MLAYLDGHWLFQTSSRANLVTLISDIKRGSLTYEAKLCLVAVSRIPYKPARQILPPSWEGEGRSSCGVC